MNNFTLGRIQGTIRDYQCAMLSLKETLKIIEDIIAPDPDEIIEYAGISKLKNKREEV